MPDMAAAKSSCLQSIAPGLKSRTVRYVLVLVSLVLAGCAGIEERPAPAGPIGAAFYLTGRVSVKFGSDAAGGRFGWEHTPAGDDMLISNALGQGVAHIVRNDAIARLTTADKQVYQAHDVGALTEKVLGWRLPLAGLPDWVRGRAMAQVPGQTKLDAEGRLAELKQSGWLVEYLDYSDGLPVRLRLSRNDVEIRLAIDQWRSLP